VWTWRLSRLILRSLRSSGCPDGPRSVALCSEPMTGRSSTPCSARTRRGIDCPLGWPLPFVEFVAAHRDGHVTVPADVDGRGWRRVLVSRATDEAVRTLTGLIPLSVAADRIAHPARARSTARPSHHTASQPARPSRRRGLDRPAHIGTARHYLKTIDNRTRQTSGCPRCARRRNAGRMRQRSAGSILKR
jgi:Protein of unknown function (DUF429)